jgi:adenylate kinase
MAALVVQSEGKVKRPNILITGTPGTGKSSLAEAVSKKIGFEYMNVGDMVKDSKFYSEYNEEFDTYIMDDDKEDQLLDAIEPVVKQGGVVVDYHSPGIFGESWFDLVLVLRADTEVLFDRLTQRNYSEKKRTENMECEIMEVVLEDARESYDESMVHELPSNTLDDMESNLARVEAWLEAWQANNGTI